MTIKEEVKHILKDAGKEKLSDQASERLSQLYKESYDLDRGKSYIDGYNEFLLEMVKGTDPSKIVFKV